MDDDSRQKIVGAIDEAYRTYEVDMAVLEAEQAALLREAEEIINTERPSHADGGAT